MKISPPAAIPEDLLERYTMNGRVALLYAYHDDTASNASTVPYSIDLVDEYVERVERGETFYYGRTDEWLRQALNAHTLSDHKVLLFGSVLPVYEAFVICFGGAPIVVDYNPINSLDPRITRISVEDLANQKPMFKRMMSISSFEHDGLGRYGDPLNPDGDLDAMNSARQMLDDDGLLFLSVPVGKDSVVFNRERVYGRIRLPKLLKGWDLLSIYPSGILMKGFGSNLQPIFVLRPGNGRGLAKLKWMFFLCGLKQVRHRVARLLLKLRKCMGRGDHGPRE